LKSDCNKALSELDSNMARNQTFYIACPNSCGYDYKGKVFGDEIYMNLSNPCLAAIHADAFTDSSYGRVTKVITHAPIAVYEGTSKNGILSNKFESISAFGFIFEPIDCAKRFRELNSSNDSTKLTFIQTKTNKFLNKINELSDIKLLLDKLDKQNIDELSKDI